MNRYGILVANDTFLGWPALPALVTPQNDIKALGETLEDVTRGGFKPLYYFPNKPRDEVFKHIEEILEGATPEDLVLFYFSGHGLLDDNASLHLAFPETTPDLFYTLSFSLLSETISKSRCRRIVIILDCCYSGAAGRDFEVRGLAKEQEQLTTVARAAQFEPRDPVETRGNPQSDANDPEPDQQGIYLLTACSPSQTAKANLLDGFGIFTRHVIDAFLSHGASDSPDHPLRSVVSVGSIYGYTAAKMRGGDQTPMLWAKRVSGNDLVIATQTLAGRDKEPVEPAQRWKLVRTKGTLGLVHLGPAYYLDDAFKFLDWNPAFEFLVARQLGLSRGSHASDFLEKLLNWPAVKTRSLTRFVPPHYPPADIESFEFESDRWGRMTFHKIATQIRDDRGTRVAWCVNLNVTYVEDPKGLWTEIQSIMDREAMWSRYSRSYDEIIGKFSKYIELKTLLCEMLANSTNCLDVGAGTGNCTLSLLEQSERRLVTAIEANDEMLMVIDSKLAAQEHLRKRARLIKGDVISCLREEKPDTYDGCVLLNVLFAFDQPEQCLAEIYRVLTPGAIVAVSTSHEHTDVIRLFAAIDSELQPQGAQKTLWEDALARNVEMIPLIGRYTLQQVRGFVASAGFREFSCSDNEYLGNVVVLKAMKPIGSS